MERMFTCEHPQVIFRRVVIKTDQAPVDTITRDAALLLVFLKHGRFDELEPRLVNFFFGNRRGLYLTQQLGELP